MKKLKNLLALLVFAFLLVVSCGKDDAPQLNQAQFSIDQSTVDFGQVEIPTSKEIKLTITNTGEEDLILKDFALSGSNASEFTVDTSQTEEVVQGGKTYELVITFEPTEVGDITAILTITSNVGEHKVNVLGSASLGPNAIINIPDANFKASLLAHGTTIIGDYISKIDTNDDGEIQLGEAQAYEGFINCQNRNISDLTGIEVFVNIIGLYVDNNKLTSLDVSKNVALKSLRCDSNQLTSLDVSQCEALVYLNCISNQLTSLNVSKNIALEELYCYENQLTGLDVSQNAALIYLNCKSNQLTSLDVSKNVALTELICLSNQLTSLDVSKNTSLVYLYCYDNQLTGLDISLNNGLRVLNCRNNKLTALNLANGNNHNMIFMSARYNNDLTCIQIDSGFTPHSDWRKDTTASYSTTACP